MQFYGQQQQAAAAQRMADYNFRIAQQQSKIQLQAAQYQAELSNRQAQLQAQAAQMQYDAGLSNAAQYEQQALRVEQEARERASRMRQENERLLGAQRARYGKSGVTSAGSPLAVMAQTAGLLELGVADELYKADLERTAFFRKGKMERFQAGFSILDKTAAQYEMAAANFQSQAAKQGYALAMNAASGERMAGYNKAGALRMGSYGSLLEGAGNVANMGFNYGVYRAG
jgi:DNA primase